MRDLANLLLTFGILFGASTAIALAVGLVLRKVRRPFLPPENAKMRLRTGAAVYRSRFMGEGARGWKISAPLQRDSYVPLDVNQTIACEVTTDEGVVLFETRIVGRVQDDGLGACLLIKPPRQVRSLDRRSDRRAPAAGKSEIRLDDAPGVLLDVSNSGARVKVARPVAKHRSVNLKLPDGRTVQGEVVESELAMGGAIIRIRFGVAA